MNLEYTGLIPEEFRIFTPTLPVEAEDAPISPLVRHLRDKANLFLPTDERELFMAHFMSLIGEIKKQVPILQKKGLLPPAINEHLQALYDQLKLKGDQFIDQSLINRQKSEYEYVLILDFKLRLEGIKVDYSDLPPPPASKVPSLLDMIQTARETQVLGSIATARVFAAPADALLHVVVEGAKHDCNRTPEMKEKCLAVVDFAKATNQVVKETFPKTHKTAVKFFTEENVALQHHLEADFGIPPDVSRQFSHDAFGAALTVAPVPVVFRFVGNMIPKVATLPTQVVSTVAKKAARSPKLQPWGFLEGPLNEFGAEGSVNVVFKMSREQPCTFFVNKVLSPDAEAVTVRIADAALSKIEKTARELNLGEAWVQLSEKYSSQLMTLQATHRLEPIGPRLSIFSSKETLPTFKMKFSFTTSQTFNEFEQCYHRLTKTLETITKKFGSSFPVESSFADLVNGFEKGLIPHMPNLEASIASLANPKAELAVQRALVKSATGREPKELSLMHAGPSFSLVRTVGRDQSLVILESHPNIILDSFLGLHHMRGLKLIKADVPRPVAIGRAENQYLLAITDMGENIASFFAKKDVDQLEQILFHAGAAYGELHAIKAVKVFPGDPLHKRFVDKMVERIIDVQDGHSGTVRNPINFKQLAEETETVLNKHPVTLGYIQGTDAWGAVAWNAAKQRIGFTDFEFFTSGLTVEQKVCAYPIREYTSMIGEVTNEGILAGMKEAEIDTLTAAFKKGYQTQHVGEHPEVEAILQHFELEFMKVE